MTVLFFARRFYPLIGGVEKHVLEVGKRLVKQGFEVTVVSELGSGLASKDKIEGINIVRIKVGKENWFKKFRIWIELFKKIDLIGSSNIIHCHDVFFWYLPFRFIFPFKKIYTTFHGYEANQIPAKKAIFMHKIAEKLSFGNICVGDFLKKWYGTNPTYVTYGGVDENLITLGPKDIKPTKDVVFLGRLEEETGIMKYLEALKILKDSGKNLTLDIFGDGSLLNTAKNYVKHNKLKVNFKGFVKNPEKYLHDYKYIFVSRYLGILEALAVKRPAITEYNNSIKKDYLSMTPFSSFISISNDEKQIAKSVNESSSTKTQVGYKWVKLNTWNKLVSVYLRLWNFND